MSNKLKPLTENKVTAEIPTEAAAFRGWAIGAHKLVLINIRELAALVDSINENYRNTNERLTALQEQIERDSVGRLAFSRVNMLEGDVAQLSYLTDEIKGFLVI